jgi:hypothetical protein
MKNMRGLMCVAVAALVVVAGCGRAPAPPVAGGGYKLYEAASTRSSRLVAVIGTGSHSVERTLPWGTLHGKHLYSVTSTTLSDIDPQTGSTMASLRLPYTFQLPQVTASGVAGGLSQDGRWLVLEHPLSNPDQVDSSGSHMLVVDTSVMKAAAPIDLPGSFQFDAVSNDGQRIYLIEYLSSSSYHVRLFNVSSGHLDPTIIFDKSDGSSAMAGLRLSGVASPDGHWLYSVYARPNQGAFIHALSLDGTIAFCIDLPGPGYVSSENGLLWSLALSADGSHLYAANGALGVVADLDTSNGAPNLTRIAHIDTPKQSTSLLVQDVQAKGFGGDGAALSPDGRTLVISGSTGVVWIDTATLHAAGRQLTGWTVWSLALSPNGNNLYAVNDSGMIAEMSMTGTHAASTFSGGPGQPMALIRVEAVLAP